MNYLNSQFESKISDVLILGAGFSGLAAAALSPVLETSTTGSSKQADDVGGTWRENTYPGCACDIPSPLYSFSFNQNPDWRELFAHRSKRSSTICATPASKLRITERIRFGTTVTGADWDENAGLWHVHTASGEHTGHRFRPWGCCTTQTTPRFRLENFDGPVFHSAHWDHSVNLDGKRVALIGTGASAIQFVPLVDKAAELMLFQRTAPCFPPKFNRKFSREERDEMRRNPIKRWYRRARLFWIHEKRAKGFVSDICRWDRHKKPGKADP